MSYFSSFPIVKYPSFDNKNSFNYLCNIAMRIVNKTKILDDRSVFYNHTITNGEKIENISYNYYGSSEYYWTILLINNIFDINYDLPLEYSEFSDYINEKYGSLQSAMNEEHYFIRPHESEQNFIEVSKDMYDLYPEYSVDSTVHPLSRGVLMKYTKTSYVIEQEINEAKRDIKLLNKIYIDDFVKTFNEQI